MMAIVPAVWVYGWTTEFVFPTDQANEVDAIASPPLFHLWFFYYLLIQYTVLLGCRNIPSRLAVTRPLGRFVARLTST